MSDIISQDDFIGVLTNPLEGEIVRGKYGTISSSYTSGLPKVKFDDRTSDSTKGYPYFASYTPAPSDRVLLLKINNSWTIIGKIISS